VVNGRPAIGEKAHIVYTQTVNTNSRLYVNGVLVGQNNAERYTCSIGQTVNDWIEGLSFRQMRFLM
jgi:hypothetical protein